MRAGVQFSLNDSNVDATQALSQRQLAVSISAIADTTSHTAPLNLCLILDHSGSMAGRPLDTVRQAAQRLVDRMSLGDRLAIVGFDHKAKVLVPSHELENPASVKAKINQLAAGGGTAIDEGLKVGIEELIKGKQGSISQAFLLTDGENEHGDNDRCLKLAQLAANYSMTINTLGFGDAWNQDILEAIADGGGGAMAYIQQPEHATAEFARLLTRLQAVGLTNSYLTLTLPMGVRLADLKPVAQVAPDTIELTVLREGNQAIVRLGDLMVDVPRVVLANVYLSQMALGQQAIAQVQVWYDDPAINAEKQLSEKLTVYANYVEPFHPQPDPIVQQHILALAKYRQTQIAEGKMRQGDLAGAATMLQTAAKTALQMGDEGAATVLQRTATQLQSGQDLSEGDRKKTRMVSKTSLQ